MIQKVDLYECTPRDGEQAPGVSFDAGDRVKAVRLFDRIGFPYVEVGFPSGANGPEVMKAFKELRKMNLRINLVAFGSTSRDENPAEDSNLNALLKTGAKYVAIVGKASASQAEGQFGAHSSDNLRRVRHSVDFLKQKRRKVIFDAEHFYDGFREDMDYSLRVLEEAANAGADILVLCDTNGGSLPEQVGDITKRTYDALRARGIKTNLGIHPHNDGGLAVANALEAAPYVTQIQGTLAGFGERVGNLNLTTMIGALDKKGIRHGIKTRKLRASNEDLCRLAGVELPMNRPYVGYTAFGHKGGIHIHGVRKGVPYEHVKPERYGNKRRMLMSHLGGVSAIEAAAEQFGIILDKQNPGVKTGIKRVQRVLADRQRQGFKAEQSTAENYLIFAEQLLKQPKLFEVVRRHYETGDLTGTEESSALLDLAIGKRKPEMKRLELPDGPINASFKLLKRELVPHFPELRRVHLDDYSVSIARRDEERSSVRTEVIFRYDGDRFRTVGVNKNILFSGAEALVKGLRYVALRHRYGTRQL
jgi:2-isopropylmalate synthase